MSNKWTSDNIPDLNGKVIIVTGANSGIGYEAVKEFSRKGAETILATRSLDKGQKAQSRIKKDIPDSKVEVLTLDLTDLSSIRNFSTQVNEKYSRLDVLVNNAGIMAVPYSKTKDGFESQLGINHLGHFALTGLLKNLLLKTPYSRVVNISSNAHRFGKMNFDNLMYEEGDGYSRIGAYGRSKLANLLFTYELDRRFKKANLDSIAVAAHPGLSNTNLVRLWYVKMFKIFYFLFLQSGSMGALPTIRAAVDPEVKGSEYFGPRGFREQRGHPVRVESNKASHNEDDARRLWKVSEKLTGIKFDF